MNKIFRTILITCSILFIIYGIWPLHSDDHSIIFDQEKIDKKQVLLSNISRQKDSKSPNIILIVADDLGKSDISFYGNEFVETDNIDRIANEGISFNEAYVSSAVCSPSRASLLTGRYQQRFGYEFQIHEIYPVNRLQLYGWKYFVKSRPWFVRLSESVPREKDMFMQGLPPSEITISEILQSVGYKTAAIGKWHLGSSDFALPTNRGFDYHYGFYSSHSLYAPENTKGLINQRVKEDFTDDYIWKGQRKGNCAIYRNQEEIKDTMYLTDRIAKESIRFMEENKDNPFFLYIPFSAPHTPLQAPEEYYEKYSHISDPYKRIYYAMIESLDDGIGEILDKVESLGIEENTLIYFISDNGGATYTLTTDNGHLKGGKITNFEGGIKVPLFMKWKSKLPEGKSYDHPVISLDIFSTTLAAAGINITKGLSIDGVDLIPIVKKNIDEPAHENLFWKAGFNRAIRSGDWKLIRDEKHDHTLLYNITRDEEEKINVANEHPDVVAELYNTHEKWQETLASPMWPPVIYFSFLDNNGVRYYYEN